MRLASAIAAPRLPSSRPEMARSLTTRVKAAPVSVASIRMWRSHDLISCLTRGLALKRSLNPSRDDFNRPPNSSSTGAVRCSGIAVPPIGWRPPSGPGLGDAEELMTDDDLERVVGRTHDRAGAGVAIAALDRVSPLVGGTAAYLDGGAGHRDRHLAGDDLELRQLHEERIVRVLADDLVEEACRRELVEEDGGVVGHVRDPQ